LVRIALTLLLGLFGHLPIDLATLALEDLGAVVSQWIIGIRQAVKEVSLGQHGVGEVVVGIKVELYVELHHRIVM